MLLAIAVVLLFPGVQEWVGDGQSAWYRPFLVWGSVIALAGLLQLVKEPDEH